VDDFKTQSYEKKAQESLQIQKDFFKSEGLMQIRTNSMFSVFSFGSAQDGIRPATACSAVTSEIRGSTIPYIS
jgi:hypothetical protein